MNKEYESKSDKMKQLSNLLSETVLLGARRLRRMSALLLMMTFCTTMWAQGGISIKGTVVDANGEALIGASVVVKGNTSVGAVTDFDGNFSLSVPSEATTIVASYVGMDSKELRVGKQREFKIVLTDNTQLQEVVVVGYGQQKKASVVGAITQTTGEVLERAAGISDIGAALTGNLPGVVTMASSGMPGDEEPQIVIRGTSSWNNSSPLVLVDGIERPMSSVDIQSVANISVLKDASATAVYGVKGANGVILITTKRGQEGKAQISVSANAIMKVPSKLPDKYDSYESLMARNTVVEHELNLSPDSWAYIRSQDFINNYRFRSDTDKDEFGNLMIERYPNVDWQRALFEDYTMSYNANMNISGGTRFVTYFAGVDFVKEGDLYKDFDNGRNYTTGYNFYRVNVRSNLDFNITKTTVLKVNIAGSNGVRKSPFNQPDWSEWQEAQRWNGIYNISGDVFLPRYSDGSWGFLPGSTNVDNGARSLALGGTQYTTTTRINTDFVLEQKLDFITKGLAARGMISWDNNFTESGRGINDLYNDPQTKWINPDTGEVVYKEPYEAYDRFDYTQGNQWSINGGNVGNTTRNLNYQLQLSWARTFGKHDVSAMGVFARQESAWATTMIPSYREDWVFRATYGFAGKYFLEYNGAYNGSEKFSKDNRFAFFNSGAIGWMISEEPFMKVLREKKILDMLKLRASYGEIGDDNVGGRFLYMNQWSYGGQTAMDVQNGNSIYKWYREASLGNPDVHWETVRKLNIGVDYGILGGLFAGSLEFFRDKRFDILVTGSQRAVPSYFGQDPVAANLGEVVTNGYELEIRFNKVLNNKMRFWANMSMTHAKNEIKVKDDPEMYPSYRKQAGYAINQEHAFIDKGMMQNYDAIYGSPKYDSNDVLKLPGDYYIVDFNGDGVIDNVNDFVPYGYSSTPQNTYNATIGFEWKGFNFFAQFYGVTNVTRDVTMVSFADVMVANVYDQGTWWSTDHYGADIVTPRFNAKLGNDPLYHGTQYKCDGSYIRLKNIELGYTFTQPWIRKMGMKDLKLFVSANNLWVWTRMPDDRESNFAANGNAGNGAYPTMRRINFGIKFNL